MICRQFHFYIYRLDNEISAYNIALSNTRISYLPVQRRKTLKLSPLRTCLRLRVDEVAPNDMRRRILHIFRRFVPIELCFVTIAIFHMKNKKYAYWIFELIIAVYTIKEFIIKLTFMMMIMMINFFNYLHNHHSTVHCRCSLPARRGKRHK